MWTLENASHTMHALQYTNIWDIYTIFRRNACQLWNEEHNHNSNIKYSECFGLNWTGMSSFNTNGISKALSKCNSALCRCYYNTRIHEQFQWFILKIGLAAICSLFHYAIRLRLISIALRKKNYKYFLAKIGAMYRFVISYWNSNTNSQPKNIVHCSFMQCVKCNFHVSLEDLQFWLDLDSNITSFWWRFLLCCYIHTSLYITSNNSKWNASVLTHFRSAIKYTDAFIQNCHWILFAYSVVNVICPFISEICGHNQRQFGNILLSSHFRQFSILFAWAKLAKYHLQVCWLLTYKPLFLYGRNVSNVSGQNVRLILKAIKFQVLAF